MSQQNWGFFYLLFLHVMYLQKWRRLGFSTRVMARPVIHGISVMRMCWMDRCCQKFGNCEKILPFTNGGHLYCWKKYYLLLHVGEIKIFILRNKRKKQAFQKFGPFSALSVQNRPKFRPQICAAPFELCGRTIGQLATQVNACTVLFTSS